MPKILFNVYGSQTIFRRIFFIVIKWLKNWNCVLFSGLVLLMRSDLLGRIQHDRNSKGVLTLVNYTQTRGRRRQLSSIEQTTRTLKTVEQTAACSAMTKIVNSSQIQSKVYTKKYISPASMKSVLRVGQRLDLITIEHQIRKKFDK